MANWWNDLRVGARLLARSPGFTAAAALSLALGIGASTTIFSLLDAALLRPLPGRDPGRLATVYTSDSSGPLYSASSYPDYLDFRERNTVFEGLAAHTVLPALLTSGGESERVITSQVSGNLFSVLGLTAAFGRTILPAEEEPGRHPVVVLSETYWRRRFAADPGVVGRSVALNGQPFTVVGIGPQGFTGLFRGISSDVFVPLAMHEMLGGSSLEERGNRGLW